MIAFPKTEGSEAVIENVTALCRTVHRIIEQFNAAAPEAQDECRDEALSTLASALEVLDESRDALPRLVGEEMAREIENILKATQP